MANDKIIFDDCIYEDMCDSFNYTLSQIPDPINYTQFLAFKKKYEKERFSTFEHNKIMMEYKDQCVERYTRLEEKFGLKNNNIYTGDDQLVDSRSYKEICLNFNIPFDQIPEPKTSSDLQWLKERFVLEFGRKEIFESETYDDFINEVDENFSDSKLKWNIKYEGQYIIALKRMMKYIKNERFEVLDKTLPHSVHSNPNMFNIFFENSEQTKMPIEMVKSLKMENLRYDNNYTKCDNMEITFRPEASKCLTDYGCKRLDKRTREWKDTVGISFEDSHDNEMVMYAPWGGESDYTNDYQDTIINKDGSVTIKIQRKEEGIPCPYYIKD